MFMGNIVSGDYMPDAIFHLTSTAYLQNYYYIKIVLICSRKNSCVNKTYKPSLPLTCKLTAAPLRGM